MANKSTYIPLDRNILEWRWYQDANTMRVWLHILLTVNIKAHGFQGITVQPGQVATSYANLASDLNISYKQARTALNHLKDTGEVAIKRYPKFLLITALNWESYQQRGQSKGNQRAITGQSKGNNQIMKECKERKNIIPDGNDDWRNQ